MLLRSPGLGLGAGRRLLKGGAEAALWLFLRAFVEVAIHERVFKGFHPALHRRASGNGKVRLWVQNPPPPPSPPPRAPPPCIAGQSGNIDIGAGFQGGSGKSMGILYKSAQLAEPVKTFFVCILASLEDTCRGLLLVIF